MLSSHVTIEANTMKPCLYRLPHGMCGTIGLPALHLVLDSTVGEQLPYRPTLRKHITTMGMGQS